MGIAVTTPIVTTTTRHTGRLARGQHILRALNDDLFEETVPVVSRAAR